MWNGSISNRNIDTTFELSFDHAFLNRTGIGFEKTMHLRNTLNKNKHVKLARDGTVNLEFVDNSRNMN